MSRWPFGFMDGPLDSEGRVVHFRSSKKALAWLAITSSFVAVWIGLLGVLVVVETSWLVIAVFVVLMVPTAGPLILASLKASAGTIRDLYLMRRDHEGHARRA
jgi:hypothetical protein